MEIYDESELTELELERQRNIIKNHEFMKSCGLAVKALVYVKKSKADLEKRYAYVSSDDDMVEEDEENRMAVKPLAFKKTKEDLEKLYAHVSSNDDEEDEDWAGVEKNKAAKVRSIPKNSQKKLGAKKETTRAKVERYPKRCSRKNYREDDDIDDDHYLFCEQCDEFYFGECTIHTSLIPFADKAQIITGEKKSLATLPDGLEIKESLIPNAGLGVYATRAFDVGIRFGPYQGKKMQASLPRDNIDTSYMWEIMKDGKVAYYVNGKDENYGNWMRFINCSRVEYEQNLVAYQYHRQIYYRAYKQIKAGEELLVWYGDEYAKDLGINFGINDDELPENKNVISGDFECKRCLKKFKFNVYYDFHINHSKCHMNKKINDAITTHTNENKHACTVCEYKCAQISTLEAHIKTHTNEKTYACTVCKLKCAHSGSLKRHMKIHTNEKAYACTVCEYKTARQSSLEAHIRIHTKEKPYACTVCEFKCTCSSSLNRHMKIHTNEKPYACTVCQYKTTRKDSLEAHIKIHTNEKAYACTVCEYKTASKRSLEAHIRIHTKEKPYACTVCEFKYTCSSSLNRHMKIHTNEKPYACTVCEYKTASKSNLEAHIRIHTKEKPYACTVCQFKCARLSSLKRHMKIHTNEKAYACTVCEYKTASKYNLEAHIRIHTKEKPYACTVCQYKCAQPSSLKTHMRIHTND